MTPEGWQRHQLRDIAQIKSGATPLRSKGSLYFNNESGIPWVKTMDLNNSLIYETDERITDLALRETSCSIFPENTVLVAMYGGFKQIGRTGILKQPAAINQAISALTLDETSSDPSYVLNYLNARVRNWRRFAASSRKDPNITREDVCGFSILLPPMAEQQKIAKILSTWDEAIAITEQLLANSEQQKKSLMQQLLTGTRRLPGSEGQWSEITLGELFAERKEAGISDLPLLSVTSGRGIINRGAVGRKDTSSADKSRYLRVHAGDIAYNTMRMWQGVSALSGLEGIVSPAYTILKPKSGVNSRFAAYLFKLPRTVHQFYRHSQGLVSDTWNLKYKQFAKIKIVVPSVKEQTAIAEVLSKQDESITLIESQRRQLILEKKALMQQLLTGKRRVKIDEAEPATA